MSTNLGMEGLGMNSLLEQAINQRDCHRLHVSGAWSINAAEFCANTGIAGLYDSAVDYQNEREYEDNQEYEAEIINSRTKELGSLTESQLERIAELSDGVCINDDGYSAYFWDFIVKALEDK